MKACLINSPYLSIYGKFNIGHNCYFPLGLGYIAALLLREGHQVTLLDPDAQRMDLPQMLIEIENFRPDIVGISALTPSFPNAAQIARMIKRKYPELPIVIGGVHASAMSRQILRNHQEFDYAVRGEGEITFLELCRNIQNDRALDSIRGVSYRNPKGEVIENQPREYVQDLDTLPHPARHLVDMNNYRLNVHFDRGIKSATMISSRGCPSQCTYCASFLTAGRKPRACSPEYTVNEIEKLIHDYGVRHILFWDDSFTLNHNRVIQICELILKRRLNFSWTCMGRVDRGNEQIYGLMKKAGCYNILFGVESGDKQILMNIKKHITLEQARKSVGICNRLGIKTHLTFILGCPGETQQTIKRTLRFAKELKPTLANFFMVVPYPGTEMYNSLYSLDKRSQQTVNWQDWTHSGLNAPVQYLQTAVSNIEIRRWLFRAYWQFYVNPGQILRILKFVDSFRTFKIYARGALGLFNQSILWRIRGGQGKPE